MQYFCMSNFAQTVVFTNNGDNYHFYRWPYPFLDVSLPSSPLWYAIFLCSTHWDIFKLNEMVENVIEFTILHPGIFIMLYVFIFQAKLVDLWKKGVSFFI